MFPIVDPVSIARIADPWIALFLPVALKGSLLVGLLLLAGRLMRSASASARHLMWTLGVVGLLLLPGLQAWLPAWQVVPVPVSVTFLASHPASGPSAATPAQIGDATAAHNSVAPAIDVSATPTPAATDAATPAGTRDAGPFRAWRGALTSVPPAVWCFSLWLSGMLPLVLTLAWGMRRLRRFRQEARPPADDDWPALLRSLCRDLGVDPLPALLVSPRAIAPMTWGLRRTVVLLPRDCHTWSEELRRQVLLHELAHVKRRDCLTQLAAQCACLLHWFNPLVWMAARRMRAERERACDDLVLVAGARPSTYADHLLQIACQLGARERGLSAGLAMARRSRIFDRLDAVLDAHRPRSAPGRRAVAAAAALILACVTGLSVLGPMARAHEGESSRSSRKGEPAQPGLPGLPPLPAMALSRLDSLASDRSISWECRTDGDRAKLELKGAIDFNDAYTGIVWMGDDARFRIEAKKGRHRTSLQVEPGVDGQPVYKYKVGRDTRPFDADAAAWLAETLDSVLLEAGIDADVRMRQVYQQEGSGGALALVDRVESEYARGIYYCEFFGLDDLRDDAIVEALQRVQRNVESDYTRASILIGYVDGHLQREGTWEAFRACLSSMKSDYETRRVLQSGLDRENRTPGELTVLLGAVAGMRSDYEAAQLLAAFARDQLADAGTSVAYFAALDGLQSDYEKANVLTTLARRAGSDAPLRQACLDAAGRLDSDYERSRVMRALR